MKKVDKVRTVHQAVTPKGVPDMIQCAEIEKKRGKEKKELEGNATFARPEEKQVMQS